MLFENLSLAVADNDFYNHSHSGFASHGDVMIKIIIIITIIILVMHIMSPLTALYNQNGTFVYFSLYSKPVLHITQSLIVLLAPTTTSAIRKSYSARFTDPKELKTSLFFRSNLFIFYFRTGNLVGVPPSILLG